MEGKGREQKLLNKGIHGVTQTKGRERICEQGQKQEPVHTESWLRRPLLSRMGRVTFLIPSQVDTRRPSGSQPHVEEGCTVVVLARTVLTSLQPLHNQGHGRH